MGGQEDQELSYLQMANANVHGEGAGAGGDNEGREKWMDAQVFGNGVNTIW